HFPPTAGAWLPVFAPTIDGFVTTLSPGGGSVISSTFVYFNFGGAISTGAYGVALFKPSPAVVQSVNVTGYTDQGGPIKHAFVIDLNPYFLNTLIALPFVFPGSAETIGYGIAVDLFGNSEVTGSTSLPTLPGFATGCSAGGGDAFVAQCGRGKNPFWSEYLGGANADVGYSIAVDPACNIYVTGSTQSFGFPITSISPL